MVLLFRLFGSARAVGRNFGVRSNRPGGEEGDAAQTQLFALSMAIEECKADGRNARTHALRPRESVISLSLA